MGFISRRDRGAVSRLGSLLIDLVVLRGGSAELGIVVLNDPGQRDSALARDRRGVRRLVSRLARVVRVIRVVRVSRAARITIRAGVRSGLGTISALGRLIGVDTINGSGITGIASAASAASAIVERLGEAGGRTETRPSDDGAAGSPSPAPAARQSAPRESRKDAG